MSATNKTTYYELPVFIATDEPKWLTDWNGAMNIIDGAIAEAKTAADNAQTTANANALAISGLSDSVSTMSTSLGTLTGNVTTLTGNVQRINELIGNGTPTTTDKTIIGAINELNAKIVDPAADDVSYDNTDSGLTATNVQDAIDELASGGAIAANAVGYDGTSSGLSATNVQAAIDEVVSEIPSAGIVDLNLVNNNTPTVTAAGGSVMANYTKVHVLTNDDASIGKIYGGISITGASISINDWTTIVTLGTTGLPTITTAYDIEIGFCNATIGGTGNSLLTRLHFNTDGTVAIQMYLGASGTLSTATISLAPCLYILKNLGD